MSNITKILRPSTAAFLALLLALSVGSELATAEQETPGTSESSPTPTPSGGLAETVDLLPFGNGEVSDLFQGNSFDRVQLDGIFSEAPVPAMFIDAGDPGFDPTEPGLPEAAIIPDLGVTLPSPPTPAERFWKRFSASFREWTSRISLGGRSLVGNSNQNFIDFAADFEKKQELRSTQINLQGQFGESNETIAANRWFANSTTDFYHGSHWMTFVKLMDQYDQLQNLDYRGTLSGGAGYRFIFEDQRRLIVRMGPGVTTEVFHSPSDNRTTPDFFGELELRLPVWARLKWEQKSIVFPSLSALEVARAQSQTALLYAFDETERWSLKFGFQYQFISEPNAGRLPNDYTTNLSIVYLRK